MRNLSPAPTYNFSYEASTLKIGDGFSGMKQAACGRTQWKGGVCIKTRTAAHLGWHAGRAAVQLQTCWLQTRETKPEPETGC